VTAISRAR
jgi:hypothetical protein